ncbi:hypothetical protein G6F40_015740 [Rhizopus arrhizus]|nr:hypothetical protein G6F40_015740 [Rhizopus arrhizus]
MRFQLRAPRAAHRRGQLGSRATQVELGHAARRERPQIVRVHHLEQRLGEFGVVVVQLLVDAGAQQCERFDHAFDVRILAGLARQPETGGDLRIPFGEVARRTA